jgi:hypothetical protein
MQSTTKPEPAKWEITAKKLRCEPIDDYVTLTMNREWLAKCMWFLKYKAPTAQNAPGIRNTVQEKIKKCTGPDCPVVAEYRDKLMAEESPKK